MLLSEHFICPSVQFLSAGRFVSRNGTPHPRRCLPETVLLTGFAGEMSIRQEEREYTLRRGEYLLLQPQRIHVGTAPSPTGNPTSGVIFFPKRRRRCRNTDSCRSRSDSLCCFASS